MSGVLFVSSSDSRQITIKGGGSKAERLFRAAVSAFCSLTRPSRRDIAQLEDLTLPLFDLVPVESLRYVAAALSECLYAPATLVRRLCDQTVDIAAPLLIRSSVLSDIDLIALIGRHGNGHARAIARRPGLNPTIARLAAALDRKALSMGLDAEAESVDARESDDAEAARLDPHAGSDTNNVRRQLQAMMRPAGFADGQEYRPFVGRSVYASLRITALTGRPAFFHTALADALEVDLALARNISEPRSQASLMVAFRALYFSDEQAFLITAALNPLQFTQPEAIRIFLSRYSLLDLDVAIRRVAGWKAVRNPVDTGHPSQSELQENRPDRGFGTELPIRAAG